MKVSKTIRINIQYLKALEIRAKRENRTSSNLILLAIIKLLRENPDDLIIVGDIIKELP